MNKFKTAEEERIKKEETEKKPTENAATTETETQAKSVEKTDTTEKSTENSGQSLVNGDKSEPKKEINNTEQQNSAPTAETSEKSAEEPKATEG